MHYISLPIVSRIAVIEPFNAGMIRMEFIMLPPIVLARMFILACMFIFAGMLAPPMTSSPRAAVTNQVRLRFLILYPPNSEKLWVRTNRVVFVALRQSTPTESANRLSYRMRPKSQLVTCT